MALCIHNSDIMTRFNNLYGSQTSHVVLCIHNNVISIRFTSLYGSQPSSVVFACKTAAFGLDLLVSTDPSPHLWVLHAKQRLLDKNYKSLSVPDLTSGFFAFKTTTLAQEIQVSMVPSPHLWLCAFTTATL